MFITISGADGVGKSTLLDVLTDKLISDGYKIYSFHHREISKQKLMSKKSINARLSIPDHIFKIIKHSLRIFRLDLIKEEFFYYKKLKEHISTGITSGNIVIVDRYIYDRHVQFKIQKNAPISRMLSIALFSFLLPKPDLAIILKATPEIIHARKPELSVEEITLYQQLISERLTAFKVNHTIFDTYAESSVQIAEKIILGVVDA